MTKSYTVTDWNLLLDRIMAELEFMDSNDLIKLAFHLKVDMGDIIQEVVI